MPADASTVAKLRGFLDKIEHTWTDQDTDIMGDYELTGVNVWVMNRGYAPAYAFTDVDGSLVLDAKKTYGKLSVDVSTIDKLRHYLSMAQSSWSDQNTVIIGDYGLTNVRVWVENGKYPSAVIFTDVDGTIVLDTMKAKG